MAKLCTLLRQVFLFIFQFYLDKFYICTSDQKKQPATFFLEKTFVWDRREQVIYL